MKKLQEGDYVRNLTEEQWNELLMIEADCITLSYNAASREHDEYHLKSLVVDEFGDLMHGEKNYCENELTFEEFKQLAINTYKS